MRIAIFSDLHGNPFACQAILNAIEMEGPFDQVVVAGDLCLGGSDPAGCIERLIAAGVTGVYGNTDRYILDPDRLPLDDLHLKMWDRVLPVAQWSLAKLSPQQLDWLRRLPFELRFSPTPKASNDLLVVHANPKDVDLMIYPSPADQIALWGDVRQPDDDPALLAALKGVQAAVIAYGHFHYPYRRQVAGLTLVDVAACSLPGIDHDPRARYSIFSWTGDQWDFERRYVPYDHNQEITALQNSDIPYKEDFLTYFR